MEKVETKDNSLNGFLTQDQAVEFGAGSLATYWETVLFNLIKEGKISGGSLMDTVNMTRDILITPEDRFTRVLQEFAYGDEKTILSMQIDVADELVPMTALEIVYEARRAKNG